MESKTIENLEKLKILKDDILLSEINELDDSLTRYFSSAFNIDDALTRKIVSFQANKSRTYYKLYKYKEAFSVDLVEYLFHKYKVEYGKILDPFAGSGTSLFAVSSLGYQAEGIELLHVGQKIIKANILIRNDNKKKITAGLKTWLYKKPWNNKGEIKDFEILRITNGAYPYETHQKIKRYLNDLEYEIQEIKEILLFALLSILESISYTRKDGQYLRWDYRAGRRNGKHIFDKGKIYSFDESIIEKLAEIIKDINYEDNNDDLLFLKQKNIEKGDISLLKGSCLDILPKLKGYSYSGIVTSPPYCNRYDYTRTYALEHAILGINQNKLSNLRQAMLSCTVENKIKELTNLSYDWKIAIEICENLPLLQKILDYLDYKKEIKKLNNNGIARMVRGYFYEMSCVTQECYRVLDKDGIMFMVNDNVRYAGAVIPVDIILSKIAETIGFKIENILVLPQSKGNSSQQMGTYGRSVLRKCVYIWKKI